MIQLTLTLKTIIALVVGTSDTVNNNSPIQGDVHLDNHSQPTCEMTVGFKPFTDMSFLVCLTITTASVTTLYFQSLSERGCLATQLYYLKKYNCNIIPASKCNVRFLSCHYQNFPNITNDFPKTSKHCQKCLAML